MIRGQFKADNAMAPSCYSDGVLFKFCKTTEFFSSQVVLDAALVMLNSEDVPDSEFNTAKSFLMARP